MHRKHQTIIEKFKGGIIIWQTTPHTILYEHPFSLSFMIQNNYRYTQWCTIPMYHNTIQHTNTTSSLVSIESVFFFRSNLFCTQTYRTETKFAHPLSLSAMLIYTFCTTYQFQWRCCYCLMAARFVTWWTRHTTLTTDWLLNDECMIYYDMCGWMLNNE